MLAQLILAQQEGWVKLSPLPDKEGFASPFAGLISNKLFIAGGANFPDNKPWEGGVKVWYDSIFILDDFNAKWKFIGKLPRQIAYGVAVSLNEGVLCIGGSDSKTHYSNCFLVSLINDELKFKTFPSLPKACANMCGMKIGNIIYIAGGTSSPSSMKALNNFWALNLEDSNPKWKVLEPWPGKERMLSVCASDGKNFYLFSGASIHLGTDGKIAREYLSDAFSYNLKQGWKKLPTMPRPSVAAVSPAFFKQGQILIPGGDDEKLINFEPKFNHPGFPKSFLAFNTQTNDWEKDFPFHLSRATTPSIIWKNRWVIPSGEVSPGIRSPEIWAKEIQ